MQLSMPDKRKAILYARITEENKKFLDSYATGQGVSLSVLLDSIIENIKTSNDSTKTRLKKSN